MITRVIQYLLGGLMLAALLTTGCERKIESKDPVRSLPSRLDAPVDLTVAIGDREVLLNWAMDDSTGVAQYRIYTAIGEASQFTRHDSTTSQEATVSDLPFNQTVRFRVTAVGDNGTESDPSETVSAVVGLLSLLIDDDNMYTGDREVQILLTVPGAAAYVMLSEDSLFGGAVDRIFRSTQSFTLSQGDGPKRVYAKITFTDGSRSAGSVYDEIILDTYASIDSVYFAPTGQTFSAGDTISFYLDAGGELDGEAVVSVPGLNDIDLLDDGSHGDAAAGDGRYSFDYPVPTGLTVTDAKVTGAFTDAAGNRAVAATAPGKVNISSSDLPDSVTLAVGLTDATTARLSWTRTDTEDFESYRVYRDAASPVSLSDDLITIITDRNILSHNDYLPNPGTYFYRVYVFDSQGQYVASNEVSITR